MFQGSGIGDIYEEYRTACWVDCLDCYCSSSTRQCLDPGIGIRAAGQSTCDTDLGSELLRQHEFSTASKGHVVTYVKQYDRLCRPL